MNLGDWLSGPTVHILAPLKKAHSITEDQQKRSSWGAAGGKYHLCYNCFCAKYDLSQN